MFFNTNTTNIYHQNIQIDKTYFDVVHILPHFTRQFKKVCTIIGTYIFVFLIVYDNI